MDAEAWVRNLFEAFRAIAADVGEPARPRRQAIADLSAPCQFTVFDFANPTWQALIVTHSRTAPDQAVTVVRPQGWQLIETFDKLLADPLWTDHLIEDEHSVPPADPEANLRWVGDHLMRAVFNQFQSSHLTRPHPEYSGFMQMSLFGSRCALWIHHGPLAELDLQGFVKRELLPTGPPPPAAAPAEPAVPVPPAPPPPRPPEYEGHGAFCSPPRTVGRLSATSIAERVFGPGIPPGRLVFRGSVGGHEVLVTYPGFVGLMTANRQEAHRWLNLIAAGFCQVGVPTDAFRDSDLGGFHPPRGQDEATVWGGEFRSGRAGRPDTWLELDDFRSQWVSAEDMAACLGRAEALSSKPYADEVPLLLEAATHLSNLEFTPSLVFSWAIVERAVGRRWRQFLDAHGVKGRRRDKLLETTLWTVDSVVETLSLDGSFPPDLYAPMGATKRVRNEVFHGDRLATREEADAALRLADKLLVGGDGAILAPPRPTPIERMFSKT